MVLMERVSRQLEENGHAAEESVSQAEFRAMIYGESFHGAQGDYHKLRNRTNRLISDN